MRGGLGVVLNEVDVNEAVGGVFKLLGGVGK
jgi:hypothetical protein